MPLGQQEAEAWSEEGLAELVLLEVVAYGKV